MAIIIKTTGLDQYAPGGNARLQMMLIGGKSVGKTRFSSFFPKPFFANCESGLASVADRQVPFVDIRNSQDMLEVLAMMKTECMRADKDRRYQTFVVDTLDAYHRKVKDEWLLANPNAQAFRGYDAWGYLETKMSMLMTRLLNLDMNIIVNCHYKSKTIKEGSGENASEREELMLQLSGDIKDTAFNDFDLIGWMGSYWEVEGGERVEKRGLSFKKTPDKPFLADRLHIMPDWMPIVFEDEDYFQLFSRLVARLDEFKETEVIGEVPPLVGDEIQRSAGVVSPGGGGALPPPGPTGQLPLSAMDKPTLQQTARDEGVPFRSNSLKDELITAIQAKRDANKEEGSVAAPTPVDPPAEKVYEPTPTWANPPMSTSVQTEHGTDVAHSAADVIVAHSAALAAELIANKAAHAGLTSVQTAQDPIALTPEGVINTATGEIIAAPMIEAVITEEQAVKRVEETLGGVVINDPLVADAPSTPAIVAPVVLTPPPSPVLNSDRSETCERCGKVLANEPNQDLVKLSYIKFRHDLCNTEYMQCKDAGKYLW